MHVALKLLHAIYSLIFTLSQKPIKKNFTLTNEESFIIYLHLYHELINKEKCYTIMLPAAYKNMLNSTNQFLPFLVIISILKFIFYLNILLI